jgi:hypothetical protein
MICETLDAVTRNSLWFTAYWPRNQRPERGLGTFVDCVSFLLLIIWLGDRHILLHICNYLNLDPEYIICGVDSHVHSLQGRIKNAACIFGICQVVAFSR